MYYYKLSTLKRNLELLTYKSKVFIQENTLVEVPLQGKNLKAVVIKETKKPTFECLEILHVEEVFFHHLQLQLANFIATYYISSLGQALTLFTPFSKQNKKPVPFTCKEKFSLSSSQQKAKEELLTHNQALLFGNTGSGKSEIYMSIMEDVLESGKNILFLMPEISLTPQMKTRLTKHFGSLVAIWHSKITKKQKETILQELSEGKVRIIAGARSALFMPLSNIGLIIVDEEHDDSYKSANTPRYNAKDLSLMYGKILNAKVYLGSATPSLTSFHKLPTIRLKETYFQTKKKFIYENAHNELTPFMLHSIAQTLHENRQVIVFVPTRANFKYLTCKACGTNIECPYCSIAMSLHKKHNILRCHYCNFSTKIPNTCHVCGSSMIESKRIGTAQVASELQNHFTQKKVAIFDRDAITTQRKLNAILKAFNEKTIDILVGTQMLSKGHDYHGVGLSVIMGLDSMLTMADFRANEKTLSLALQIAGRSGRKGDGTVFIQTQNREFFKQYIEDYDTFLHDELPFRETLYPPYKKLLRLLVSHKNETICQKITHELLDTITSSNLHVEVVGSGKANIEKIANKYRYYILLRASSSKPLLQLAHLCNRQNVAVDIDPLSFS